MSSSWLLPCAFFAVAVLLILATGGTLFAVILWIDRSDSPRAGRLRRLLGGREKKSDAGEKRFFWLGEDRTLRTAAAREFARSHGWEYAATDSHLLPLLAPFQTLPLQSTARIEDTIRWQDGDRRFVLAAYIYADSESTYVRTLLIVSDSSLRLPPFLITNKTAAHSLLYAGQNLTIDDDAEFSSRFHVESSDHAAIRNLLSAEVRQAYVAASDCRVECIDSKVIFSDEQMTTTAGYANFLDSSMRLLNAMTAIK
jgi:hypothetical protein